MKQSRLRILLTTWFVASLVVFAINLIPVLARYRIIEQELVDLEFQRLQPTAPKVVQATDSPWPTATIQISGQAIRGLDDENVSAAANRSFSDSSSQRLTMTFGGTR